jgi:hypothetical protein
VATWKRQEGTVTTIDAPDGAELAAIERRLLEEFVDSVPPEVVQRCVLGIAARFDQAHVRTYVPILVERMARDWLHDAVVESAPTPGRP